MRATINRPWLAIAGSLGLFGSAALLAVGAAAAAPGCAKVASDFNGDGHGDLAVAEPEREPTSDWRAGAVRIAYGSAAGLGSADIRAQTIRRTSPGMPALAPGQQPRLGPVLRSGFLNADCYADLAVQGAAGHQGPGPETIVLFGSAAGLSTAGAQSLARPTAATGFFGASLAAGDFDGDGWDELAVGAPTVAGTGGGVAIYRRGTTGISATPDSWWTQDTAGVPGTDEDGDAFAAELAAGDFDGDGRADLAVASVNEDVGTVTDAGGVVILKGSADGLTAAGSQWLDQNSPGVPDSNEAGDSFGANLGVGDVTGDRRMDLVVGVPTEDVGAVRDAGAVTLLPGSATGPTGSGAQTFTQDSPSVPGSAEQGDRFGNAVSIGDFNADGYGDLAAGSPGEAVGTRTATGTVTVLYGRATGLVTSGVQRFDQDSPGVPGGNDSADGFGTVLRAAPGPRGHHTLAVGVPQETAENGNPDHFYQGAVVLLPGGSGGLTGNGSRQLTAVDFGDYREDHAHFGAGLA